MNWNTFVSFLGHGGFKLLLIGFFLLMKVLKGSAKKAAKERPTMPDLPNAMPSQMQSEAPSLGSSNPRKTSAKSDLGSPWDSSSDPFDGEKQ